VISARSGDPPRTEQLLFQEELQIWVGSGRGATGNGGQCGRTARAASRRAGSSGTSVSPHVPPALRGRSVRSANTPTTQVDRHFWSHLSGRRWLKSASGFRILNYCLAWRAMEEPASSDFGGAISLLCIEVATRHPQLKSNGPVLICRRSNRSTSKKRPRSRPESERVSARQTWRRMDAGP